MAVRTWVGRFCVIDGRVEEDGPWLGSLIRQRPDEEADELYVLVEPSNTDSAEYTSQLVDVIGQLYNKDPLSLTGALTRSMRAAHEHLRDWNRKSLREHQVGAGSSCLALRGTDAYLAQVGPSVAYVLTHNGDFRRLHADPPTFEESLGVAEQFEPRLRRIPLAPGDLVLLASTSIERLIAEPHVRRILERGADDALSELYQMTKDEPDMSLVLLSCFEQDEPLDALPAYLSNTPQDDVAASLLDDATAAQAVLAGALRGDAPKTASASLAFDTATPFDLPRRPLVEQVAEIAASTAPAAATGVRLRGDSATPRYKRSTGNIQLPQLQIPRLLIVAILALAAVGALVWWQLPRSVAESREDKFITLLADARSSNARAQAISDAGLKRELLAEAQANLDEAAKIHDDNGELIVLQADVASALGVLDAVYEVRDFTPIADLAQVVTGSLSITHTVTGAGQAFLLDAKGRRVLRIPLDGSTAPETILAEGEPAGFVTAGLPMEIAWSEQTQSLMVLDDQRQAFAYFPDRGALPLTIRGADGWASLDAITATGGNLYLLDVDGNQVWRYLPGQGGFDSERTALLDNATLTNATELAVGQDVYVLDTELGIRRFVGKAETEFALAGIDRPLMSPASLSVLPGSNRLVVADRANKRIVVASAEGAFLRQIVSPAFTDLRAVAVDEGTGTLYVLNGDTLMTAAFPP